MCFEPPGGLKVRNETKNVDMVLPKGRFSSLVNTEEVFVLCASNSASELIRSRFGAEACVEIGDVRILCQRIQASLPSDSSFRAGRVEYYSTDEEPRDRWAYPEVIAFLKLQAFSWQDEFRFCVSPTDALARGNTKLQIVIDSTVSGAQSVAPDSHEMTLHIGSLKHICKLVVF